MIKSFHSVLLYYCYTAIEHPEEFKEVHHRYCLDHALRGRIIIAREGINGTVSGPTKTCEAYMRYLRDDTRFSQIHFKVTPHHQHVFRKLHVRVKPEIVHAGLPEISPLQRTGKYVTPEALEKMRKEEDVVLLDVRSNYEHKLGKFKGAVTLDINHFREFPQQVVSLNALKQKKLVTYCTGGVKCEKASAYLLQQGFKDVYQLHGGIIQYGIDTDGADFEGTCYVFDNRLSTVINQAKPTVISRCDVCHTACDRMVNCANPACNKHVPMCAACADVREGTCSARCQQHPQKRPYDGTGYYTARTNGYNPYQGIRSVKK